ncbi:MAG TPA: response regulator [Pyrinomonadaceae bacterium]|jgi:PleD family two-component response regulator
MSEASTEETPPRAGATAKPTDAPADAPPDRARDDDSHAPSAPPAAKRVLLVADEGADAGDLRERLKAAGFEAEAATAERTAARAREARPAAVLLCFGAREGEARLLSLARRLRAEPSSFALPVVFLFREDPRALRSAAQHLGADDYFTRAATAEELRARLEALLWRAEAGRRSAPAVADQRSEIDNFLFLLDAVGADSRAGAAGSLALVEAGGGVQDARGGDAGAGALEAAHGFLKLNLRRVDAVAFYGPATLLVYLPGADAGSARATLARLREEFAAEAGGQLFVGVSSFPAHGSEVERLVEQAEAALGEARGANSATRVVVYGFAEAEAAAPDAERRKGTGARTKDVSNEVGGAASAEPASVPAERQAAGRAAGAQRAGGRPRRVMLVVSDAARMAQVNLLMRSSAYEVRAAFDGQHALNLLRIDRPDALVVDYELNEMDGAEMLRRLAKQSRAGHAPPALLLVPAGREDLRGEALAAGARAVIDAPYDAVELLDTLRELCETE